METTALPQHPLFAAALARLGAPPERIDTPDGPVTLVLRRIGPLRLAAALRAPPLSGEALRRLRRRGLRLCEPDRLLADGELGDDLSHGSPGAGGPPDGRWRDGGRHSGGPDNSRDRPACPLRQAGFRQVITPAHVAELPLGGDARDRRARMQGKWRNRLNRAERAGLAVRDLPFAGAPADWLVAREGEMRRARRYRTLHPDVARAWAAADPGAARLFLALEDDGPVAGMLFLVHGAAASYHMGWSGPAGRAAGAHHLLLARAADWLADSGVLSIDLGTVDTEGTPGLARFKTGAGARIRPLGGSWMALPGL